MDFSFEGYPLETLDGFSVHQPAHLSVKSQGHNKQQGSGQLACISRRIWSVPTLKSLHIGLEASKEALIKVLASTSDFEELFYVILLKLNVV